eukprot:m.280115 g.280115  ORF g.280115 m.280115 type:complete len:308 (+) comp40629_c0_seq53:45-968(+)
MDVVGAPQSVNSHVETLIPYFALIVLLLLCHFCVSVSKVGCSLLGCTSRCLVGTCCNSACAAGCFLPVSDQGCNECKYLEDGNSCRGQGGSCTADHELLGLRLCVSPADCPENFLQESDPPRYCGPNCVANLAQTSSIYNELTGQCQSCTGLSCAKKCPGMEQIGPVIHKGNIAAFTDCNIVQGSIHIDQVSFTGDNSAGIEPLTFSDLHTLANVTEINGYLAITGVQDPSFTDLSFLASLRAIRGRYTLYASNWSLYIENNQHVASLKTNSLERIDGVMLELIAIISCALLIPSTGQVSCNCLVTF